MPKGRYLYIEAEFGGVKIREQPLRPEPTFTGGGKEVDLHMHEQRPRSLGSGSDFV